MIQRLLFDGINGEASGRSVTERVKLAADVFSDVAEAGLAFAHPTEARTESAKDAAVIFLMPPQGFFHHKTIPLL
jgi:hypothetical protein